MKKGIIMFLHIQVEFEDAKRGVIKIRKSKARQHNGLMKKDKRQRSTKHYTEN